MSKGSEKKVDVDVEEIWDEFSIKQRAEFTESQDKFGKTREERIVNFQKKIEFTKEFEKIFNEYDDELKAEFLKRDKLGSVKELIDDITKKEDFFQNYENYHKTWIDGMKNISIEEIKSIEAEIKKEDALQKQQKIDLEQVAEVNGQQQEQKSNSLQHASVQQVEQSKDQILVSGPSDKVNQLGQENNLQNTDNQNVGVQNPQSQNQSQVQSQSQEEDLYSKIMNINLNRALIIDSELLVAGQNFDGTKKYHELSKEEQTFLAEKLSSIASNSSTGLHDELYKSDEGRLKFHSLKEFDESSHEKSFNKLSESINFQNTDYKLNNDVKISEIKSPDGEKIGSLEKTKRTVKIGENSVDVWQTKLNLDEKSNGFDVAAKLYLYDDKGNQSDLSIIIGKDKNGIPLISAQLDIETCKSCNKDDLVTLKREGKTFVMPITYNDYEKYHEAMLNKAQFKDMDLSKNMEKQPQIDKDKMVIVDVPKIDMKQLNENNKSRSNSMVVPRNSQNLGQNKGQNQH
jgi:hypothetical protein